MRKKSFTAKTTPKYLIGFIMLLPIAMYYFTVYLFAENIPLADDFSGVLGFLNSFISLEKVYDKVSLIFSQLNEHRVAVNRLCSLAVFKINGVIDFKILIFIGNIMLLPAIYAFYISFKKKTDKFKYFLPAVFIIAVPQFSGSMFWATSVVQNISCLAFSLLALALLKKEGVFRALMAFVFAVLSVFSSVNGLLVFPSIIVFLLITKKKKLAVWWSVGALFIFLSYLYGYTTPIHHYKYYYTGTLPAIVEFFFSFIGSPVIFNVFYMKNLLGNNAEVIIRFISAVAGAALCLYFIFLVKKKYYKVNTVIFTMFIFFFLTAIAAAITRSGIGLQAFASRYRIIPVFMFALTYLSFVEISKEKTAGKYFRYLIVLTVLFSAFSYITNIPAIKSCRENLVIGITSWQKDGTGLYRLHDNPASAEKQLKESIEKGIYLPKNGR
ncbi:MAG: hypothetical protein A2452_07890 [Candidatus Firestonebacteria bacterium RIFOXYC2_FULL_39_67]|nr:MAG: hypothetical protein A2536_08175 [Candidatus Firestonebacteria bacterium RIFOXYD2_FULL_39_29]OGF54479.1 MAG: hypothetical protein A2497_07415 [Candidatus Firestonebacteria bacterium RifOxyC12_full_39_7]OGF56763.1 MAG: hypothetical protein A2452_07890 [Candidatus Firestonebacteria bacterium RIFOXYC2_FULL_39_67]